MNADAFDFDTELKTLLVSFYGRAARIDTEKGFELAAHRLNPALPRSPTYFNLRTPMHPTKPGPLTTSEIWAMARLMYEKLRRDKVKFDGICGVPDAGQPFAKALQELAYELQQRNVPRLTLRKGGGLHKAQELPRGSRVLLVDDLISDAGSKVREGVDPLRYENYLVEHCIVFLDREQGGAGALAGLKPSVQLHAVTTANSVFDFYQRARLITPRTRETLRAYHAA